MQIPPILIAESPQPAMLQVQLVHVKVSGYENLFKRNFNFKTELPTT